MTDFRDRGKRIPAELLKEMRVAELGAPSLGMVERMTAIYNAIKAWEAQNNIASERGSWISIKDRMPAPSEWVLVYNGKWRGVGKYVVGAHLEPSEQWQAETTEFIEQLGPKVTHWQPLPEPPK